MCHVLKAKVAFTKYVTLIKNTRLRETVLTKSRNDARLKPKHSGNSKGTPGY